MFPSLALQYLPYFCILTWFKGQVKKMVVFWTGNDLTRIKKSARLSPVTDAKLTKRIAEGPQFAHYLSELMSSAIYEDTFYNKAEKRLLPSYLSGAAAVCETDDV